MTRLEARVGSAPAVKGAGPTAAPAHFRDDIQGLRTLAVAVVVLFHLWPNRMSGGYVGVDVFFVISGFLITGHLLREATLTGTVNLTRFWARRIARLLPASFLVLALVLIATFLVVPQGLWPNYFAQIRASALYFQNWELAWSSVDYMAIGSDPTAVQHYWSLSVEEQFYLVWPTLLVLALYFSRRKRGHTRSSRALLVLLIAVFALSFAFSIVETQQRQSWAYFASFTRVWEFAVGGIVALAIPALSRGWLHSIGGALAGWVGIGLIVWAAFSYSSQTLFPGYAAAAPVVGAALLLLFGNSPNRISPRTFLSLRPAVWVGNISYSVYLWHYPLIVLVPVVTLRDLSTADKAMIIAVTLLAAQLSTRYLENPLRNGALRARPAAFTFAIVGGAIFLGATAAGYALLQRDIQVNQERAAELVQKGCVGPAALDPARDCGEPMGPGDYVLEPEIVMANNEDVPYKQCQQGITAAEVLDCHIGVDEDGSKRKVILAGDSHATHWAPSIAAYAEKNGWSVEGYFKASCPISKSRRVLEAEQTSEAQDSCEAWTEEVLARITQSDADTVVLTSYQSAYDWGGDRVGDYADPVQGFAALFEQIADSGKQVVVIKAVPRTQGAPVPGCLMTHGRDVQACGLSRAEALPDDKMALAVKELNRDDVQLIDLDDQFCDAEWCYPVVGDVVVYRDYSHLTPEYAELLAPWVWDKF